MSNISKIHVKFNTDLTIQNYITKLLYRSWSLNFKPTLIFELNLSTKSQPGSKEEPVALLSVFSSV